MKAQNKRKKKSLDKEEKTMVKRKGKYSLLKKTVQPKRDKREASD